jgi:hypothetical protein
MTFTTHSEIIRINELWNLYNNGNITKPRIQRKQCWLNKDLSNSRKTNNYDFIKFIIKTKSCVNPLLLVEKRGKFIIIDGNNRINAIINFIKHPLKLFDEHIPESFKNFSNILHEIDLKKLTKGLADDVIDFIEEKIKKQEIDFKLDNICKSEIQKIRKLFNDYNFMDIDIPLAKFKNIKIEEINDIYAGVNKGGIKLKKQDILACTSSLILYDSNEINDFNKIKTAMTKYYDAINKDECLKMNDALENLNLFEILFGYQKLLAKEYNFIEEPGSSEFDMIFKLYKAKYQDFDKKNDDLDKFLTSMKKTCGFLNSIFNKIYNSKIKNCVNKTRLSKNAKIVFLAYLYKNIDKFDDDKFRKRSLMFILYAELCCLIKDKETRNMYDIHALSYSNTRFTDRYIREIFNNNEEHKNFKDISKDKFKRLFNSLLDENLNEYFCEEKPKSRKKLTKFKIILLSLYFNRCVPLDFIDNEKDLDHIIPWCCELDSESKLDFDRIGNLILIDSSTNKIKSNKLITSKFIRQHNLQYYNYPLEKISCKIFSEEDKKIVSCNEYNKMCKSRENYYVDKILESLPLINE